MATITERFSGKVKTRGDNNSDSAVRIFDVVTTGDVNTEDLAMDAVASTSGGAPGVYVGSKYKNPSGITTSSNNWLYCKQVSARPITPGLYEVTANYGIGNYIIPENPVNLPWRYQWRNVTIESPFDRDINGNPIVNSARCPFSTNPTKRISFKSLKIVRNEAFYNYALYKTYENTVNSDTISFLQPNGSYTNFGPGTIFCVSIEPCDYTSIDNYIQMNLNFEIWDLSTLPKGISDPFQFQALDIGSAAYYSGTQRGNLYTPQGEQCSTDQQLNGFGIPVDTTIKVGPALATPVAYSTSPAGATLLQPTTGAFYLKYLRYNSVAMLPLLSEPAQSTSNVEN